MGRWDFTTPALWGLRCIAQRTFFVTKGLQSISTCVASISTLNTCRHNSPKFAVVLSIESSWTGWINGLKLVKSWLPVRSGYTPLAGILSPLVDWDEESAMIS